MTGGAHSRTTPGNRMDINQGMVEMTADIPVLVDPSLPTVSKNCQSHVIQSISIGRHIRWHVDGGMTMDTALGLSFWKSKSW